MKFLIDECLSTKLPSVTHAHGYFAEHVAHVGLAGQKDWDLIPYLLENDLIMVTRNSKDFRGEDRRGGLLTSQALHPGLIFLNAKDMDVDLMVAMFKIALQHLQREKLEDLLNQVLELDLNERTGKLVVNLYDGPD